MFDKASLKLGLDKALLQSVGADKKIGAQVSIFFFLFIYSVKNNIKMVIY